MTPDSAETEENSRIVAGRSEGGRGEVDIKYHEKPQTEQIKTL